MPAPWEKFLQKWIDQGLIDPATAEKIRSFEVSQSGSQRLRWPVVLVIAAGGILVGAGVLLFVAAHWDSLSPSMRFGLVLSLVAIFHLAGAFFSDRFHALSQTMHFVGTAALGGGIFLAGQIFHLQEHWPGGVLLWAVGAWIAWAFLRDWTHAVIIALLTPFWLGGEWLEATHNLSGALRISSESTLILAITYLTAVTPQNDSPTRKALQWIGGLWLVPAVFSVIFSGWTFGNSRELSLSHAVIGWSVGLGLPLLVAWYFRRRAVVWNVVAAAWVLLLGTISMSPDSDTDFWRQLSLYLICAAGSVGLVFWGLKESRQERINLGVAGFGLTVFIFYFSTVMDKLGRATSLVGLGLLFLLGGWMLEKTRRQLVHRVKESKS